MKSSRSRSEPSCDDDDRPAVPGTSTEPAVSQQPQPRPRRRRHQQERPLLMRRWLQQLADSGEIPGLEWIDQGKTLLRIPWCHESRSEWNAERSALFKAWAEHKGQQRHVDLT